MGKLPLAMLATAVAFSANPNPTFALEQSSPPEDQWFDSGHKYVIHHADNLAEWMDNFFGSATTEAEAPYSTLRLRYEQDWDEEDDFDTDIKLRGKVYLPKLNKRLSLLFSDDDDANGQDDLLIDKQDTPDDVALQYTARQKKYYRVDFKVGLRSSRGSENVRTLQV